MTIQKAFDRFMEEDFENAVDMATKAYWSGSGYSVELFPDGHYRVLWNSNIGNRYDTPGVILGIRPLGDDEWDNDKDCRFYDNAEDYMREAFNDACL